MAGYVVVHTESGSISEVYETEDEAQLARLEQIQEHLPEAVEHEFEYQEYTTYSRSDRGSPTCRMAHFAICV